MESTYCSGQGPYGRSQTAVTPVPHDLTLTSDSVALPMHMLHIHTCRKDVENRNKALFVFLYFSETGLHYVDDHMLLPPECWSTLKVCAPHSGK